MSERRVVATQKLGVAQYFTAKDEETKRRKVRIIFIFQEIQSICLRSWHLKGSGTFLKLYESSDVTHTHAKSTNKDTFILDLVLSISIVKDTSAQKHHSDSNQEKV